MANTTFSTADELVGHLNVALTPSPARAAELFREFQESGYLARQEPTGLSVIPKFMGGTMWGALAEGTGALNAPGNVPIMMLSHPSVTDEEFDGWVEVVQQWVSGLPYATQGAYSREIRAMKKVEDGIPITVLNKSLPPELLIAYRRARDFVIVIDSPVKFKRKIFATKNIG